MHTSVELSSEPAANENGVIHFCGDDTLVVNITCDVKDLPHNDYAPRVSVVVGDVSEHISITDSGALQKYGLTVVPAHPPVLKLSQVLGDAYRSNGMTVYCQLNNGQIRSPNVTYVKSKPTFDMYKHAICTYY